MKYSIIVPIFQEANIFSLFVDSLVRTAIPDTQVIFINDGSGSAIQSRIEKISSQHSGNLLFEIIEHPSPQGTVISINQALDIASGEYIIFLDSDVILSGNWQESIIQTFSTNPNIGIAGALLLYPQSGGVQHCGLAFSSDLGRHLFLNANPEKIRKQIFAVQAVVFALCAVRKEVFETIGHLDENYFNGYEDLDFQMRAKQAGFDIVINPNVMAYHWEKSNGIHRNFNRKNNLGRFWRLWGNQIETDLWDFIRQELEKKLSAEKMSVFAGIDLAEVRSDARVFWEKIKEIDALQLNKVTDYSSSVKKNGALWLPEIFDKDFYRDTNRFLFLVDNFVRLLDNWYWFDLRKSIRDDDLIVDLYGNVIDFKHLSPSFWPGTKFR